MKYMGILKKIKNQKKKILIILALLILPQKQVGIF